MPYQPPKTVGDVLRYYSAEVVPALAAALTIDDEFPEEVLNEVRSSFTHLARANNISPTHDDHAKELGAASRHLKRVCLDCLKVCVLTTAQRCENAIEALTEEHQLPDDVYKHMSSLRNQRASIAAHEGQQPTHEAVEQLKYLFDEYDKFYVGLDDQFAGQTADMRRNLRRKKQWQSASIGFVSGILASLCASWIWSAAI